MAKTYEHFGLTQVISNTIFRNFTVENVGFMKVFSFDNFPQFPSLCGSLSFKIQYGG